jgi:hypothetical protein
LLLMLFQQRILSIQNEPLNWLPNINSLDYSLVWLFFGH